MKTLTYFSLIVAMTLSVTSASSTANAQAVTECMPSDQDDLNYSCNVKFKDDLSAHGVPLNGKVQITMPSMPLAHNVPPSKLELDHTQHGTYKFETTLEMFGEWLFTYELDKPDRRQIRNRLMFKKGAVTSSEHPVDGGSHGEDHSGHGEGHGTHNHGQSE